MNVWFPRTLLLIVALAGLGLTGCGSSTTPALSITAPDSAGPPAAIQEWIVGEWNGVVDLDREAAANIPEMTPDAISVIESMRMIVKFSAEGEMHMSASMKTPAGLQESSSTASWEVVEANGDLLRIKSREEGHDPEEVEIKRLDAKRFSMPAPQNVGAMVFTSAK